MPIRGKIEAAFGLENSVIGPVNSAMRAVNRLIGWEAIYARKISKDIQAGFFAYNDMFDVSVTCTYLKKRETPWILTAYRGTDRKSGKSIKIGRASGKSFKEAWKNIQPKIPGSKK